MKDRFGHILKLTFFLIFICAVCAVILATVYSETLPVIEKMQKDSIKNAYSEVYKGFDVLEEVPNSSEKDIKNILIAKKDDQPVGVIYNIISKGYAAPIDILLAFDIETSELKGVKILKQAETPGLGANAVKEKFMTQFLDKDAKERLVVVKKKPVSSFEIEAVTAATITSQAVVDGVNIAREHFIANFIKER